MHLSMATPAPGYPGMAETWAGVFLFKIQTPGQLPAGHVLDGPGTILEQTPALTTWASDTNPRCSWSNRLKYSQRCIESYSSPLSQVKKPHRCVLAFIMTGKSWIKYDQTPGKCPAQFPGPLTNVKPDYKSWPCPGTRWPRLPLISA